MRWRLRIAVVAALVLAWNLGGLVREQRLKNELCRAVGAWPSWIVYLDADEGLGWKWSCTELPESETETGVEEQAL